METRSQRGDGLDQRDAYYVLARPRAAGLAVDEAAQGTAGEVTGRREPAT